MAVPAAVRAAPVINTGADNTPSEMCMLKAFPQLDRSSLQA
jgi:hypothetical protein